MGREAKAKAARRDPQRRAFERALARLEIVKQNIELYMRTPAFKEAFDTRALLLVGTPEEIANDLMSAALAKQLVSEAGYSVDDIEIRTLLRHGRLQIWVEISRNARLRVAEKVRDRAVAAAAAAG